MRVDDFVNFGRTVPEPSKRYGTSVCMAGYSNELNTLLRIYPMPTGYKLKSRTKSSIELERNIMDSRQESWALKRRDADTAITVIQKKVKDDFLIDVLEKKQRLQ